MEKYEQKSCDFECSDYINRNQYQCIIIYCGGEVFALTIVESSFNYSEVQGQINLNQRTL
jgi:hypothetical protein